MTHAGFHRQTEIETLVMTLEPVGLLGATRATLISPCGLIPALREPGLLPRARSRMAGERTGFGVTPCVSAMHPLSAPHFPPAKWRGRGRQENKHRKSRRWPLLRETWKVLPVQLMTFVVFNFSLWLKKDSHQSISLKRCNINTTIFPKLIEKSISACMRR